MSIHTHSFRLISVCALMRCSPYMYATYLLVDRSSNKSGEEAKGDNSILLVLDSLPAILLFICTTLPLEFSPEGSFFIPYIEQFSICAMVVITYSF